jgi:tRNA(Ile)-lysidine synthase
MIKVQGKIPRKLYLSCSGGVDSMAILDFLRNNHEVTVLHVNHGTSHGLLGLDFMENYCVNNDIEFHYTTIDKTKSKDQSYEEFWRNERYAFFKQFTDHPIVTCHHLDDCVETWIFSSLHGDGRIIPYRRNNIIRPFRLNRKRDLELWANLKNVPHIEDPSNDDPTFMRNYIRHTLLPHALKVNPGLHKNIKKKVVEDIR